MQQIIQIVFNDFKSKVQWFEFEDNFEFIGEGVSEELDTLDKIPEECSVKSLSHFVGKYIVEDSYEFGLGGEWFSVNDGLETVNGLLNHLHNTHRTTKSKSLARKTRNLNNYIVQDLESLRDQLKSAVEKSGTAKFKLIVSKIPQDLPALARAPMVKYPYQP